MFIKCSGFIFEYKKILKSKSILLNDASIDIKITTKGNDCNAKCSNNLTFPRACNICKKEVTLFAKKI